MIEFENDLLNDMKYVLVLAKDINNFNELIETTDDPELKVSYYEELLVMIDKFKKFEEVLEVKLEFYLELCNKHNEPININFFKVLSEMKKSQKRVKYV